MLRRRKPLIYLLCLFLFLLGAQGCSIEKGSQPEDKGIPALTQINASYSTRPINVPAIVALDRLNFEKAFQAEGIDFKWTEIAAGPAQLEALASKSIDISTSMNYVSALLAKANGNDIRVVAGYSQFPEGIAIVAGTDRNVKTLADLKGKKIALQKGTMLHEFLIKALEKANLSPTDVEMVAMESVDAAPAMMGGQIDAAILPEPLLTKVISSGKGILVQNAEGFITGQTFIVARSDFALNHPEAVKRFIQLHEESIQWAEQNKEQFYTFAGEQLKLEPKAVEALYPKFVFSTQINSQMIHELKESAQFLQKNGFIKSTVNTDQLVDDLVDISFL
ncbi:ABC transporter, substrate-binding protein, aliphatic sulfonates family [Desulfitobacterium dehalogenans ATCC 51507]|uniref:ABC transporter, substrate-binding protein, aliphatic sulfonates family n=1 Tax=Desulfitobacterium dehalogenans (strain ATCC 51507 / DSM 9161 / JW/IU-DC1) TaxID=756499 RepID=I4ABL9_DESDJ|nr:NrtA/SsuA/CpmA family ABC transporter substrate-binding protein [Desulfitobacterium dehalogenans]AFM01354.1 ABC transporter, substrate-binding protein, aliphatic sulfonates family [Desulfitobacterium dehalogenans ATCC 51507]